MRDYLRVQRLGGVFSRSGLTQGLFSLSVEGASPKARSTPTSSASFLEYVKRGDIAAVTRWLMDKDDAVRLKDEAGWTALHLGALHSFKCAQLTWSAP